MDFLKKNIDKIVGIGAFLILALFSFRVVLFLTFSPPEENSFMATAYEGLGIEAAPVVDRPVEHPRQMEWSFDGRFGHFDKAAVRRGLQVYREVCSACHSLDLIAFRNLTEIGYSVGAAKAIAASYQITAGPDRFGDMYERPGILADNFPAPFDNPAAAAISNGGKAPPDLSLMAKARADGPNYIHSLLTGYVDAPVEFVPNSDTTTYNPYFDTWEIVMPPPLFDGFVEYEDGTEASVEQMSKDVTNFLMWTAEPNLEARLTMGFSVVLYSLVLTLLLFFSMKTIWRRLKP